MFDTEKFLALIEAETCLWLAGSKDFLDKVRREECWCKVGQEMYKEWSMSNMYQKTKLVAEMKNKWRHIRDNYTKYLRNPLINKKKKYVYADIMGFLEKNPLWRRRIEGAHKLLAEDTIPHENDEGEEELSRDDDESGDADIEDLPTSELIIVKVEPAESSFMVNPVWANASVSEETVAPKEAAVSEKPPPAKKDTKKRKRKAEEPPAQPVLQVEAITDEPPTQVICGSSTNIGEPNTLRSLLSAPRDERAKRESDRKVFLERLLQDLQKRSEPDADRDFLVSLLPDYRRLSYEEKLDFRVHCLTFFKHVAQARLNIAPHQSTVWVGHQIPNNRNGPQKYKDGNISDHTISSDSNMSDISDTSVMTLY